MSFQYCIAVVIRNRKTWQAKDERQAKNLNKAGWFNFSRTTFYQAVLKRADGDKIQSLGVAFIFNMLFITADECVCVHGLSFY